MGTDETLCRIRSIHKSYGSSPFGTARRDEAASGGIPETGDGQPTQARAKKKGGRQTAFPFPRPCLLVSRFFVFIVNERGVRPPLADDLSAKHLESLCVAQLFPVDIQPRIKSEGLFVDVAEQVERFN